MNINHFYSKTLKDLSDELYETNKRTGIRVKALPGVTFRTDLEAEGFPLLSMRKIPMSFVPEVMWMLSGSDNIKPFLTSHTKIWDSFAEADGTVTAAYGKRLKRAGQLELAIEKLREDHSTRHAVAVIWDPYEDGILRQKNVPCPVMFTLNIIGGRLHMHVVVRSNDMVLGFPTDVAGFALMQCMIADKLNVRPGVYTHSISNAHYYENQQNAVDELLSRRPVGYRIDLDIPLHSYERACALDETLVAALKESFLGYSPYDAIKNIPIAL